MLTDQGGESSLKTWCINGHTVRIMPSSKPELFLETSILLTRTNEPPKDPDNWQVLQLLKKQTKNHQKTCPL